MKYNVDIANFLDAITSRLKMSVAVQDNGEVMWVYDFEEHKRFSITSIVRDILDGSDLTMFSVEEVENLCSILPNKKERELALRIYVNDSDYIGG